MTGESSQVVHVHVHFAAPCMHVVAGCQAHTWLLLCQAQQLLHVGQSAATLAHPLDLLS